MCSATNSSRARCPLRDAAHAKSLVAGRRAGRNRRRGTLLSAVGSRLHATTRRIGNHGRLAWRKERLRLLAGGLGRQGISGGGAPIATSVSYPAMAHSYHLPGPKERRGERYGIAASEGKFAGTDRLEGLRFRPDLEAGPQ